ncbi:MAG: MalM family protein [Psychromonas sp.]
MKKLSLVLLAGLLVACSSSDNVVINSFKTGDTQFANEVELSAQLRSAQIQPVTLNKLQFQMASLENNNRIDITADSPVVNFPEGNSFVAALFLPENISGFTFVLESKAGRTVFVPSVTFLDENLQEVARIDNAQFKDNSFFSIEKAFSGEQAQSIRYMLVYSKDSELNGKTEVVNVAREYELNKGNDVSELAFPRLYAKHSPIGRINIRFENLFFSAEAIHNRLVTEGNNQNKTTTFRTPTVVQTPTILTDTETFYLEQISKAVKEGNLTRAKKLVEEAERAGSKKAKSHYSTELGKQQQ